MTIHGTNIPVTKSYSFQLDEKPPHSALSVYLQSNPVALIWVRLLLTVVLAA